MHFLETLKSLPIDIDNTIDSERPESLLLIVKAYNLSSYDAAYLDIALRLGHPLATLDTHLRKAGKQAGVKIC